MKIIKRIQVTVFRRLVLLFFHVVLLLFFVGANSVYAKPKATSEPVLHGCVDSLVVKNGKLIAQGWAGAAKPNNKIVSISIWAADTLVYKGNFERLERPDVVTSTGRNDWLKSGWRISMDLPSSLKSGEYPIQMMVKLDNGDIDKLVVNPQFAKIIIDGISYQSSHIWSVKFALIFMSILIFTVYFQVDNLSWLLFSRTNYLVKPPVIFGLVLFLSFWVSLGLGLTGSSFNLGLQQAPFVQSDLIKVWGKDQPIRSDEWLVFTPLAIAQYNHHPQFPIVNKNIGEDGQNMLVVGMAGVPVAHISAIAKPATWGFFLFDLKRALSWYWCFPIFACLFALWGVVALLLPGQWRSSFLIALWFSISPYVAAWSNWPAYTVFFPSLVLLSAIAILRSQSKYLLLALSCILGVALAGFVLILYPPWQISVGYIFLALIIGLVVRDKLYRNFNKVKIVSYGIAIIIAGVILWKWWTDAHPAIQAMMATVYPGQRIAVTGGNSSLPDLLRGFTNLVTLHKLHSAYSNQSEIASFCYMLLPLSLIFVFRLYKKTIGAVEIALAVSISFILYFMLTGVSVEIAQFSLWGRVPPNRADIALGLSHIILCGLLLSPEKKSIPDKMPIRILAFIVALIWGAIVFNSISHLHESILAAFSPGVLVGLFFVVVAAGYYLAMGKFREFIYLNLALSVATTLPFNPIYIAPHSTATLLNNEFNAEEPVFDLNQRILVLETQIPAMFLLASGYSVINGVFYYPQNSLWERLDKEHTESNTYNRYQHLFFSGGIVEGVESYRIETPQSDVVRVVVDLERFDFHKTGAGILAAPQKDESALKKNSVLAFMKNEKGWSWFQITRNINDN
jgi:hypothetical protein